MPWHKITPGSESKQSEIEAAFKSAWTASTRTSQATRNAVLYCTNLKDSIRNPFSYYFSPDCSLFFSAQLLAFGASVCPPPEVDKLATLCSYENAKP